MGFFRGPKLVTAGLVFALDAGSERSYIGSGTSCYDLSNTRDIGTLISTPVFDTDGGGCFIFDGTNYIELGIDYIASGEIGVGDVPYTIESWFKITSTPTGVGASAYSIMGSASSGGIGLQVESGPTVNFGYRSTSNYDSTVILSLDTWYHVVGTHEVGVSNYIYINGGSVTPFAATSLTVQSTTGAMQIGAAETRIGSFIGKIAVAKLYNRHLTAVEVLQNFNAQKGRFGL